MRVDNVRGTAQDFFDEHRAKWRKLWGENGVYLSHGVMEIISKTYVDQTSLSGVCVCVCVCVVFVSVRVRVRVRVCVCVCGARVLFRRLCSGGPCR